MVVGAIVHAATVSAAFLVAVVVQICCSSSAPGTVELDGHDPSSHNARHHVMTQRPCTHIMNRHVKWSGTPFEQHQHSVFVHVIIIFRSMPDMLKCSCIHLQVCVWEAMCCKSCHKQFCKAGIVAIVFLKTRAGCCGRCCIYASFADLY